MKAIINRNQNYGTIDGVFAKNSEIQSIINKHLKTGTAKKLVDTDDTLMYELTEPSCDLHPVFKNIFKQHGIC